MVNNLREVLGHKNASCKYWKSWQSRETRAQMPAKLRSMLKSLEQGNVEQLDKEAEEIQGDSREASSFLVFLAEDSGQIFKPEWLFLGRISEAVR